MATVVVRSLADPATIGETFELGGPRYWTYREITDEVLRALGKRRAIVPMPIPLIRLVAGAAELVHLPFPVATDQLRQLRLDNVGPLDLIPSRFGFEPRPMEGALGYLRRRPRDQFAAGGMKLRERLGSITFGSVKAAVATRPGDPRLARGAGRHRPRRRRHRQRHGPSAGQFRAGGADLGRRREVAPLLDAATTDLSALADQVAALGIQARGALAALNGVDTATVDEAIAAGNRLVADLRVRSFALRRQLAAVPYVGTPGGVDRAVRRPRDASCGARRRDRRHGGP